MDKIRANSELKAMKEQMNDQERQHGNELNRVRREMERLRTIIGKTPNKAPNKKNPRAKKFDGTPGNMSCVSSMENMSVTCVNPCFFGRRMGP